MSMLYQAYQNHMDLTEPWRTGAASALRYLNLAPQGVSDKAVRPARRCARTDLALIADLYAPAIRHRQRDGGQPRARGEGGGRLRDAVRLAAALQEGGRARAAEAAAGGADVRAFRDAAARHREDAAAGSRRLHHRLAQSARHPARRRPLRARRLHRAPHQLPRPARPAPAYGRDLPAVGVGARGRRDHVRGQSSLAARRR